MKNDYVDMVKKFTKLDIEEKKEEILNRSMELLKVLYYCNKKIDSLDEALPIINSYNSDEEYFNKLYTIIISLQEENAKYIKNTME